MTLAKRLEAIERRTGPIGEETAIIFELIGATDSDIIGIDIGPAQLDRLPGETRADLIERANAAAASQPFKTFRLIYAGVADGAAAPRNLPAD